MKGFKTHIMPIIIVMATEILMPRRMPVVSQIIMLPIPTIVMIVMFWLIMVLQKYVMVPTMTVTTRLTKGFKRFTSQTPMAMDMEITIPVPMLVPNR